MIGQYVNILLTGQALNEPSQAEQKKILHVVRQRQKTDKPGPPVKAEPNPKPVGRVSPEHIRAGTRRRHRKTTANIKRRHADQGYYMLSDIEASLGMKRGAGSIIMQRLGLARPSGRRRMLEPVGEAVDHAHVQTHRLFWDGEWVKGKLSG